MAQDLEKYTREEALNIMLNSNVSWTPLEMKWTDTNDNSDKSATGNTGTIRASAQDDAVTAEVSDYKSILVNHVVDDTGSNRHVLSQAIYVRFDTNPWVAHGGTTLDHIVSDNDITLYHSMLPMVLNVPQLDSNIYFHMTSYVGHNTVFSIVGLQ